MVDSVVRRRLLFLCDSSLMAIVGEEAHDISSWTMGALRDAMRTSNVQYVTLYR